MKLRTFIRETSECIIGIGLLGNITWSKNHFIDVAPTTTDILGPFYRPNAPIKININPTGYSGELLHFSRISVFNFCQTVFINEISD